uniref:Peptidase M43 pregnancy-associated plasma-A domain-containing protein n=1 Tax=Setaria digitata TaxID=48799 RepID=A0A915PK42_9BILA
MTGIVKDAIRLHYHAFPDEPSDHAVYFNGSTGLRLSTPIWQILANNMRFAFTLEIWVQIDGGQPDSATIIALNDICGKEKGTTTWKISIETELGGEHGAHLVISLRPELSPQSYHVRNGKPHRLGEWIQITAAFDSHQLLLYVNGARVGKLIREVAEIARRIRFSGGAQKMSNKYPFGILYSEIRSACKRLYLATDGSGFHRDEIIGFRGFVKKLRITDRFLDHSQLIQGQWEGNAIEENFTDVHQWRLLGARSDLGIRKQEIPQKDAPRNIEIPHCGQTACDNPTVASNYLHHWNLHAMKKLKYRVVVISDDNGSNENMKKDFIMRQHAELLKAFLPYNITWDLEVINIRNTSLRRKTIVFGCQSSAIGNKRCDIECRHAITGDDGGDCKIQCDLECNNRENHWDNGDCCTDFAHSDNQFCIDPTSIYRRYINVEEYKTAVGIDNENGLTVQFGDWIANDLVGFSTFPWEKEIYSNQGGVLLRYDRFGTTGQINNLIHEIGHILGLWHVHHGISEVPCGDPCQERTPSMTTGDMISDTNPTVKNTACADPETVGPCDATQQFRNTPFRNYMSYTGDNCANTFTAQQKARMHCYIDLKYTNWMVRPALYPNHIAVGPRIIPWPKMWATPLSGMNCGPQQKRVRETHCTTERRIVQYAISASSSEPFQMSGFWGPEQATGKCYMCFLKLDRL